MSFTHDELINNYPKILNEIENLEIKLSSLKEQKKAVENFPPDVLIASHIQSRLYNGCHCGEYNDKPKIKDLLPTAHNFIQKLYDYKSGVTEETVYAFAKELIDCLQT
jgi:hypothetical protein